MKQKGYRILGSVFISITENSMYLRTLQVFYKSFNNNSVFHTVTLLYGKQFFVDFFNHCNSIYIVHRRMALLRTKLTVYNILYNTTHCTIFSVLICLTLE